MKTNYILAGCFASKRDTLQQSIEKGDMELEYKSHPRLNTDHHPAIISSDAFDALIPFVYFDPVYSLGRSEPI